MAVTAQDLNNTNAPVTATSPYGTAKNSSAPTVRDGTNIDASTYNQNNNGVNVALLRAAGIIPSGIIDNADISQVAQAIQSAIAKGNLVEDLTQSGTPNTIVLSSFRDVGNTYNLTHPVAVLQDKQQFRFVAAQTNTSISVTLQASQLLVAKNIIGVQSGDISTGTLYIATYNAATDDFTIRPEIFVPVQDNILDNGDFIIAQRGTTFDAATTFTNIDGNYTLDRWKVIDSRAGSDVVDVSQTTLASELPAGARAAMKLAHQRQNEQAGIVQYIDYDTTRTLLNQDTSLSFEIYNSDSVTRSFRAAIITWQGTADDMPNDPIATWQTAANLGFATNFTTENTTTALTANATSWNRFTINGVNIDTANTNNLAVVIWTDETMANGYEWRATKVKLEQSSIATVWKAKNFAVETSNCLDFFQIERLDNTTFGIFNGNFIVNDLTEVQGTITLQQPMRKQPTLSYVGNFNFEPDDTDITSNLFTQLISKSNNKYIRLSIDVSTLTMGSSWVVGLGICLGVGTNSNDTAILFDANL